MLRQHSNSLSTGRRTGALPGSVQSVAAGAVGSTCVPGLQEGLIEFPFPVLILHGISDRVVPIEWSIEFSQSQKSVSLVKLNSDHQLLNRTQDIWEHVVHFLEQLS